MEKAWCRGKNDKEKNKQTLKCLVKIIHTWVYSFARPGYCEDEGEYNLLKKL